MKILGFGWLNHSELKYVQGIFNIYIFFNIYLHIYNFYVIKDLCKEYYLKNTLKKQLFLEILSFVMNVEDIMLSEISH